jgi:hypothetical protein
VILGRQLIWVTHGPKAGDFMEVDDADADEAEAEGWGQRTAGRDGMEMRKAVKGRHRAAESYLDRRSSGYENRELRAAPAPSPAKPEEEVKKRNAGGRRPLNDSKPT